MGNDCCCPENVDHEAAKNYVEQLRARQSASVLIMAIKDQNMTGKVYLCGAQAKDPQLLAAMKAALQKTNQGVQRGFDEYDVMWDVAFHNTRLTTGFQMFSATKPFFPIGKHVVGVLDALAKYGWVPTSGPNYGGAVGKDASVTWPSLIFEQDRIKRYTCGDSLFFAIKDQNVPGKLCAAGPPDAIGPLKERLTKRLQQSQKERVALEFDQYDTGEMWDAVWLGTSITSGMATFSAAKPYFPKGHVCLAILHEVYALGWRLVAAPSFGGNAFTWPCFVFRRLVLNQNTIPPIIIASIKDQNVPGKICLAGSKPDDVTKAAKALRSVLMHLPGNEQLVLKRDEYDEGWDEVLRNTNITTGCSVFSSNLSYFPRGDATTRLLNVMSRVGWTLVACPNFGGQDASWPTFVWEWCGVPQHSAFVAIKDQNFPGKVCFSGVQGRELPEALRKGFQAFTTESVQMGKDAYDESYSFAFSNTKMTSGSTPFSNQNAWWPHGFPLEMVLLEMGAHGWKFVGGPCFGTGKLSWPALVLQRDPSVVQSPPRQANMQTATALEGDARTIVPTSAKATAVTVNKLEMAALAKKPLIEP